MNQILDITNSESARKVDQTRHTIMLVKIKTTKPLNIPYALLTQLMRESSNAGETPKQICTAQSSALDVRMNKTKVQQDFKSGEEPSPLPLLVTLPFLPILPKTQVANFSAPPSLVLAKIYPPCPNASMVGAYRFSVTPP